MLFKIYEGKSQIFIFFSQTLSMGNQITNKNTDTSVT